MERPDLTPATTLLADLVATVPDDRLSAPTPCEQYTVGDLLDHIGGLAVAFTDAATKAGLDGPAGPPPPGDAAHLPADWRTSVPEALRTLGRAWQDPDAWTGMTRAGGVDLPGEIGGVVALDEVVVHGWDLASALGAPWPVDEASAQASLAVVESFPEEARGDAWGPALAPPPGASTLDRLLAVAGRDPSWTAPA